MTTFETPPPIQIPTDTSANFPSPHAKLLFEANTAANDLNQQGKDVSDDHLSPHAKFLLESRNAAISMNQDRLEMLATMPDNADNEALRRATYMNIYRKCNDIIALQVTGEEWQKYLQSGTQLIEEMKSSRMQSQILSARSNALKNILSLTKPPAAGKIPTFDSTRFVMTVEGELLAARETLTVLTDESQKQAIENEISYLQNILTGFNLPANEETIKRFDLQGKARPDEKRGEWRKTGKRLAQLGAILGTGTIFFGTLATTVFSESGYPQAAGIWGVLFALSLWGPNFSKTKVEKIQQEMQFTKEEGFNSVVSELRFMQERDFQDFSSDHRGKLTEVAEKLMANRPAATKAIRTLLDEKKGAKTEEKKTEAREKLRSLLGDDPETQKLLNNEQKFIAFALPILDHAKSPEAQQVLLTYLSDAMPPTEKDLSHEPPPTQISLPSS